MIELNPRFETTKAIDAAKYAVTNKEFASTRVSALESKLETMHNTQAVAVSSGTSALELVLANLCGGGGEVITSIFTFPATYNAIRTAGLTPVFADVDWEGLITPESIEKCVSEKTVAIMPVHIFGLMANMNEIYERWGRRYFIIEDACQAIGSKNWYYNEYGLSTYGVGQFSDAAVLSFYRSKNIGFNEGGAVLTNDSELALNVAKNRNHQSTLGCYGKNMRMSEVAAAFLAETVEHADHLTDRRYQVSRMYNENGIYHMGLVMMKKTLHNHHLFTVEVDPEKRDEVQAKLLEAGYGSGVYYDNTYIAGYGCDVARKLAKSVLSIPCHGGMSGRDVDIVSTIINQSYTPPRENRREEF